jgi:hypothetical protein
VATQFARALLAHPYWRRVGGTRLLPRVFILVGPVVSSACKACGFSEAPRSTISSLNLNSVNQLIFVMVKCGVLFEVRTEFLNNI